MGRPKISALVASAIRNLRETRGSTSKEIMNYIKTQFNTLDVATRKQICTALKRGLDYGILKRDRGYYSLNMEPEVLYNVAPLEQGRRRRRRRRRRGRARSRAGKAGRGRGRGRRRSRRRGRRGGRGRSRGGRSTTPRTRSMTVKCRKCTSKKHPEDTLRATPVESLRKDITYLHKDTGGAQTPFRQHSRSRDRSRTRSPSSGSDKDMIDDMDRDQP